MKQHKEFWKVYSQREVSNSEFLQMAREMEGKTEEEMKCIFDKYAKEFEKNPKREHPLG